MSLGPDQHLHALDASAHALVESARGALDRPVPACPDWDVADLVVHVGQIWAWAAEVVGTGARAEREPNPEDRSEAALLEWATVRAERIVAALGAADPDGDCWTFGEPRSVRFWFRRQALETVLHAWDVAQAARPGAADTIDPEVAADGLDEHLSVLVPRSLRQNPGDWSGETFHLHRSDGEGEWLVRLGPEGAVAVERRHGKGDVALRASAEALWLWATNRAPLDALGIECFGDGSLAERWRAQIAF